jgi:hypothetical protein
MKKLICYCLLLLPLVGYSQFYEEEENFEEDKMFYDIVKEQYNCVIVNSNFPQVHINRYITEEDEFLLEEVLGIETVITHKYYIELEIGKAFDTDKVLKTVIYELGCKTIKNE